MVEMPLVEEKVVVEKIHNIRKWSGFACATQPFSLAKENDKYAEFYYSSPSYRGTSRRRRMVELSEQ